MVSTTTVDVGFLHRVRCDLLKNIYLCGINNNQQVEYFQALFRCDLLKNIYLCGINNNLILCNLLFIKRI